MVKVSIDWICGAVNGTLVSQGFVNSVEGISIDSRTIRERDVFVAIKGENFDGHEFVKECLEKGVRTFIVKKDFFNKSKKLFGEIKCNVIEVKDTVKALSSIALKYREEIVSDKNTIGVTGSSGKTTTKYFISQVLSYKYNVISSPKSYNNHIGVPLSMLMIEDNTEFAVIEMGMNHKGEISKLSKIVKPNLAVVTNIGYAHIGLLKSQANIASAKSEIIDGMKKGDVLLLRKNIAFENIFTKKALKAGINVEYFDPSEIKVLENLGLDGFVVEYKGCVFNFPVIGVQNIDNLACALKVAEMYGIKPSSLEDIISNLKTPEMRNNIFRGKFVLIDDSYNANPDSMKKAIDTLSTIRTKGKKIVVLGDMLELGEFSEELHLEVVKYLAQANIDYIILYGEEFSKEFDYLIKSGRDKDKTFITSAIVEIGEILNYIISEGDIVLVKASRGMRLNEVSEFLRIKLEEKSDAME